MSGATWVRVGAVLGGLGVALGAFGAHALKEKLAALGTTATYHTAVQYHIAHSLALGLVGLLAMTGRSGTASAIAGWAFLAGTVLFSGSLYGLALGGPKWLGPVTPFGGISFLAGWAALAVAAHDSPRPGP